MTRPLIPGSSGLTGICVFTRGFMRFRTNVREISTGSKPEVDEIELTSAVPSFAATHQP